MTAAARVPCDVSVVVVTYRSAGYVGRCLESLAVALAGMDSEIVVVDNDSGDAVGVVVEEFAARTPVPVRYLPRGVNDGFAGGCHAGAQAAAGRRLLLVNPDVTVDADTVLALVTAADSHPAAGLLGGRALTASGATDPRSWWGRPTLWSTFCFATGLSSALPGHPVLDPESPDRWDGSPREVDAVSGGLVMMERRVWDELGGLDRSFLLYGEDVDVCLRARAAGWRPRVVPEATFRHEVGRSSDASARTGLVLRGKATLLRRHLPAGTRSLGVALLVLGCGLRAAAGGLIATRRAGRPRASADQWRSAWASRHTWAAGWRPEDTLGGAA